MIRKANNEDIDAMLELLKSYSDNTHIDSNYSMNDMNNNYSKYIVYELDKEIIGMINYHKFDNKYGEIIDIVVNEKNRRNHIGSSLLEGALNDLKEFNVTLEVREDNESAIKLYKKYGFEIIQTREKYYKGKNAYIMEKESKW